MGNSEEKAIRKGQVFRCPNYGLVKFVRLDYYHGECTAELKGVEHPGTYYPKIEFMIAHGFTVIDN